MAKGGVTRTPDDDEATQAERPRRSRSQSASRRRARGRSIVAALLLGFVLVASAVIWRRSYGVTLARELSDLDRERIQLEAERAQLRGEIEDASSRGRLEPALQRLGMRVPSDKQVRILSR